MAIFSVFYSILYPNLAILLILEWSLTLLLWIVLFRNFYEFCLLCNLSIMSNISYCMLQPPKTNSTTPMLLDTVIYLFLILSSFPGCRNPKALGMENKQILNSQLSASTWAKGMEAPRGRLNGALAWRAGLQRSNFEVWYQVDFIKRAKITSLKARGGTSYYVKKFKLFYSNNEIDFLEYKDVMGTKVRHISTSFYTFLYKLCIF